MKPVVRLMKRTWPPEGTNAWFLAGIRKSVAEADAGMFATEEAVEAAFDEPRKPRAFWRKPRPK